MQPECRELKIIFYMVCVYERAWLGSKLGRDVCGLLEEEGF
jgi:hypothetical protein